MNKKYAARNFVRRIFSFFSKKLLKNQEKNVILLIEDFKCVDEVGKP